MSWYHLIRRVRKCVFFLFYAFIMDPSCVCIPQRSGPFSVECRSFSNSVTCPFFNKVFSVAQVHRCYLIKKMFYYLSVERLQNAGACCPAHRFKHTPQMGAVFKGSICVCVCESACCAHSDCIGLYLLNMPVGWLIVKSSHRVHTLL